MRRLREWMSHVHLHGGTHLLHSGHKRVHLGYFGLVFVESHGLYGWAAGILAVYTLFDCIGKGV